MHTHPRTLASMATSHRHHPPPPPPPPPTQSQAKPLDLEVTIVSAKHLKNVNWRTGDLKPYVVFWSDPDFKLFTKADESGSTRPVWNERFTLPFNSGPTSYVYLDVFHAESPSPLVGSLRISLSDLPKPDDGILIRTFELTRPSGRPQGKIRIKLCVKERNLQQKNYDFTAPNSYFCVPATAPLPPRDYRHAPPPPPPPASSPPPPPPSRPPREYTYAHPPPPPSYGSYHGAYSAPPSPYIYSGFYSSAPPLPLGPLFDQTAPPLPSKPSFDQTVSGGLYSVPSAPVEHTYEERQRGGGGSGRFGVGVGTRSSVGAVTGRVGGLALDEGVTYELDNIVPRDSHSGRASEYGDYHRSNY